MLNIVFRVDSSDIIGSGHVYRCLNLAFSIENSNIEFICKNFNNNCIPIIEKKYKVNIIENNENYNISKDENTWLGESFLEDAEKTVEILKNKGTDWLVIDHYSIERNWEQIVKPYVKNILVIEDHTNREHLCDVLLNQNLQPSDNLLYRNLTPNGCKLLLGKEYLLFNSKFVEASKNKKNIYKLERINVFMGGGDYSNETEKIIEICNDINIKLNYPFIFDVVIGLSNKNKKEIEKLCKKYKNFNFYWNVDNMEKLYSKADLAIGAIGFSSYERCIMKLPTLSIVTAKNQETVLPLFLKNNIIEYLGDLNEDYATKLTQLILKFYRNIDKLEKISENCQKFINYNSYQNFSKTINNILEKMELAINGGNPYREEVLQYGKQTIDDEDIKSVISVLQENKFLTTGPRVEEFEENVSDFVGLDYGVAVNSGTAALHLAVGCLNLNNGDEVIVTCLSFVATSNAIIYCGGTPVFCDIEEDTMNIDPDKIEKLITEKTKAILVVDFAGQPCDYKKISEISKKYKLVLIEDASHSLGCNEEKTIGFYSDLTTFSFHPVKNMTTCEGGMIVTNNKIYYEKIKRMRSHGISIDYKERQEKGNHFYDMTELGFNHRIPDLLCALGINQLKNLSKWIKRRQEIASIYDKEFQELKNYLVPLTQKFKNAYHIYVIKFELENLKADRDLIFKSLKAEGLGVNVHYLPIHLHTYYREKYKTREGMFPIAEEVYKKIITLPLFPTMSEKDIYDVINIVKKIIIYYKR